MYLDISPPLTSNFAALVVREVEEDRLHHRTYIHAHTYTIRGTKECGGENSIDVFSMRLKINLSPRARALSSLALGLRRDATRRDALLSRMETNYVFHVEERFSSLEASIDGGGGRGGGDSSTPGRHQHVATCLQPTARSIEPSSDERRGDDR